MKRALLNFLPMIVLFTSANAQTIPEPHYYNQPYYLNSNNQLQKIEHANVHYETRFVALGYAGHNSYYLAFGQKSPVRIPADRPTVFVVKLHTNEDPAGFLTLMKGKSKKTKRRFVYAKNTRLARPRNISGTWMPILVEKVRPQVFKITVIKPLLPGEYAFEPFKTLDLLGGVTTDKVRSMFCFGVD